MMICAWAGLYGLGAQPAQLGAFVYTDKPKGDGHGVYFRLVPGTSVPKASMIVAFPDNKPNLPVELPVEATVKELLTYVAAKRQLPKHSITVTRGGKELKPEQTLLECGFSEGVAGYRVNAVYKGEGMHQIARADSKLRVGRPRAMVASTWCSR